MKKKDPKKKINKKKQKNLEKEFDKRYHIKISRPYPPEKCILIAYLNQLGVEFYPNDTKTPVGVFKGDTRTSMGKRISIKEALSEKWIEHLGKAGAVWFIKILKELKEGRPLEDELIEEIRKEAFKRVKREKFY